MATDSLKRPPSYGESLGPFKVAAQLKRSSSATGPKFSRFGLGSE